MFNEYVWKLYLEANGKETVERFERNFKQALSGDYAQLIEDLHNVYSPPEEHPSYLFTMLDTLKKGFHSENAILAAACNRVLDLSESLHTRKHIFDAFYKGLKNKEYNIITENQILNEFCAGIYYYTTFLAVRYPDFFVPYYFVCNYNVLEKIAQDFDIALPEIPAKKNYKERIYHYRDVCAVLHDFKDKHGMSPYELYAFLYDFAPKYIGGIDSYIIKDLPAPKSVFFIGGSGDDVFNEDDSDMISSWQCNPDTKAGDLIVMYLRTPISAIDSIWRSVSVGFQRFQGLEYDGSALRCISR